MISFKRCFCPCGRPREEAGQGNFSTGMMGGRAWAEGGEAGLGKEQAWRTGEYRESLLPSSQLQAGVVGSSGLLCPLPKALCLLTVAFLLEMSVALFLLNRKCLAMGPQGLIPCRPTLGPSCLVRLMRFLFGGSWQLHKKQVPCSLLRRGLHRLARQ